VETFMPTDLLDARTNLHVGAWYLRQAFDRWSDRDDPPVFALAEYVAGLDAVNGWCGSGGCAAELRKAIRGSPTGEFVEAVLERARRY
jgi:soluble lytic murein transglycosylase-like protein